DPAGRLQTGLVHRALIDFYGAQGDTAKATEAYRKARDLFKQLSVEFPNEPSYKKQLGECFFHLRLTVSGYHNKAIGEMHSGRYQEAARILQHAGTLSETLITEAADNPSAHMDWYAYGLISGALGYELWAAGQTKEAEASFSKALSILKKTAGFGKG